MLGQRGRRLFPTVTRRRLQRSLYVRVFVGCRVHEPVFNVWVQIIDCTERFEADDHAGRIRNGDWFATADGDRHRWKLRFRVKAAQSAECGGYPFVNAGQDGDTPARL